MAHTAVSPTQSPTKQWGFGAPEKIDFSDPSVVAWSEAAKFSEDRVKVIEHVMAILRKEEVEFVGKERKYLENTMNFLETFYHKAKEFVEEEERNIQGIKAEIHNHTHQQEQIEKELEAIKAVVATLQHKIATQHNDQQNLINRIGERADLVNVTELGKIKLGNPNDVSNDLFRWVSHVIYQKPADTYEWTSFKKSAFTADKGKDFMSKLRGLNARSLKREDFVYAKTVVERKEEIMKGMEPKGKENVSARRLFDYIASIVEIGDYHDQIVADNLQLEEKHLELGKKQVEAENLSKHVKPLESKVEVSNYYIDTLRRLLPSVDQFMEKVKARANIQDQYVETIKGNIQEIDPMAQSVFQTRHADHDIVENNRSESPKEHKHMTPAGPEESERVHEGHTFEGDGVTSDLHDRKVQKNAPQIDLKESEFANSKKNSCESCGMF